MNKPTPGPNVLGPIATPLIVDAFACYRACRRINPDNPLAVAEALPELVEAVKWSRTFTLKTVLRERLEAALAKLESK